MKTIRLIRVIVVAMIIYTFCMYMFGYQSKNRNKTLPKPTMSDDFNNKDFGIFCS